VENGLRIGLDLTPLPDQPVGAGVYMLQLVRHLALEPGGNTPVVIYQRGKRHLIEAEPLPNVEWVETADRRPGARLVWEQLALPGLARRLRLDLLHSLHYTRPYRLPCASVVTFHDMTFFLFPHLHTRVKRLVFPQMMRMSARRSQALIADSESTRRDALRILHIPPEKITTVPLGIGAQFRPITDAPALEACRRRYNLPPEFILYVGTVEPRKNLPMLLRAYAGAAQAAHLPLVVVGRDGWMFEQVYQQVDELDLKERVRFTGYMPGEDLPMVYNLAQVFVYPSLYEGFGFPPLEAMACGTPVITTAISSMQDQVGDAGWLTPPGDETALCAALDRLAQDVELRHKLTEKGLQRAAQFTWSETARRTLEVYKKVAGQTGRVSPRPQS
jgi:glycosyltransferase involved in cell wall biosynthesis